MPMTVGEHILKSASAAKIKGIVDPTGYFLECRITMQGRSLPIP